MSEVSLEAESGTTSAKDVQMDCVEADKTEEILSEDVKHDSVDNTRGGDDRNYVMYDIDIDSAEDNTENGDKDVQKGNDSVQSESAATCTDGDVECSSDAAPMSGSVDDGGRGTNHRGETAETPEENGECHTQTKVIFTFTLAVFMLLFLS